MESRISLCFASFTSFRAISFNSNKILNVTFIFLTLTVPVVHNFSKYLCMICKHIWFVQFLTTSFKELETNFMNLNIRVLGLFLKFYFIELLYIKTVIHLLISTLQLKGSCPL